MVKKNLLIDTISPEIKFSLLEDAGDSEVDGVHVLAKVRGQFFVPDGKSRNGRFYSRKLWENVIGNPAVQTKIKKKLMFGTVGHDAMLGDKAVREGVVSHFMHHIEIDESNKGIGEAWVLNTPVGRILNTVLRAGSELYVSSRANGTFSGKKNGLPAVDENTYDLDGWDFVIDPGFLEADPKLSEALNEAINEQGELNMKDENGREITMDERLVKHITNENAELKVQVGNLTDEVESIKEDKKTVEEENTHLKTENDKMEEMSKVVESLKELGTVEEIKSKLEEAVKTTTELAEYKEFSKDSKDAKETLINAKEFISGIKEQFGTVAEISEYFEKSDAFMKEVAEIGTIDEINISLDRLEKVVEEKESAEKTEKVKALAEELNMTVEKVAKLLEKLTEEEIKEIHGEVSESLNSDAGKYTKKFDESKKKTESDDEEDDKKKKDDEEEEEDDSDISESDIMGKSRIERMNERLAK